MENVAPVTSSGLVARGRAAYGWLHTHRRWYIAIQVTLVALAIGFGAWAVASEWKKAGPRLEHAQPGWIALAFATVAAYYLVFILGWIRMLKAWGIDVPYIVALQAEMVSMLAKYLPGGVWTPAARAVALRRAGGVTDTPTVLASILIEAVLSAISGVIVFVLSLAWVRGVDAPLPLLIAFGVVCAALLHPRVFKPVSQKLLRPFGAHGIEPLPFPVMVTLLVFYCGTWIIAGFAVYFMLLGLGANPGISTVAFLGGVSAIGAIVAVLAILVPSGLGVREATMYGLLLAVTDKGSAISATLVNRLAITLVELALFGVGVVTWRFTRVGRAEQSIDST